MGNCFQRVALLLILLMSIISCSSKEEARSLEQIDSYPTTSESGFIWPLKNYRRVTREFKMSGLRNHEGIDIPAPQGTPIYNVQSGRVIYAGKAFSGYGKMILIEHDVGVASIYGHLYKILVKPGQFIDSRTVIGLVGQTGRASAPHLHFEMRLNKKPVNPREYLP